MSVDVNGVMTLTTLLDDSIDRIEVDWADLKILTIYYKNDNFIKTININDNTSTISNFDDDWNWIEFTSNTNTTFYEENLGKVKKVIFTENDNFESVFED